MIVKNHLSDDAMMMNQADHQYFHASHIRILSVYSSSKLIERLNANVGNDAQRTDLVGLISFELDASGSIAVH
jgi:hypothetical protein